MSSCCVLFWFLCSFCSVLWCAREKDKEKDTSALSRACVALPLGQRNTSDPMVSASGPANELAKQLRASASSLNVSPPAANTVNRCDCQQRPRSGACYCSWCCFDASRGPLRQKAERTDYMRQVFIPSYLPFVYLFSPFWLLVMCRRYFKCT